MRWNGTTANPRMLPRVFQYSRLSRDVGVAVAPWQRLKNHFIAIFTRQQLHFESNSSICTRTMDSSTPQEHAQRNDAASAGMSEERAFESNGESLYDGGDDFWGAVDLPDWSQEHTTQRSRRPRNWCNGCQCEHPWPKDGYTFHVRSRRANAYLRSLQLAGHVPTINPLNDEPLAEVSGYRVSRDAYKMGLELLKRLRDCASGDNSGGGCCSYMLIGGFLDHPGYAGFQTPSNAEEFFSSAEGADAVTKWNEFFEPVHKQHRDSFPAYCIPNTGGVPRYFYGRLPLLAEQAQSDSHISSHGQPSSYGSDQGTIGHASRNRLASG